MHERQQQMLAKDDELRQLRAELNEKNLLIQRMENTFSWKITKPLRILRNLKIFECHWSYQDASWKGKLLRFCAKTFWPKRLILQSGLFDQEYYLKHNPDVAQAGVDPLRHFLRHGGREGRKPNPFFDSAFYLQIYPDVQQTWMNPLVHYLLYGGFEERDPSPIFASKAYLDAYPDILSAGINPLVHYVRYGQKEGRIAKPAFPNPVIRKSLSVPMWLPSDVSPESLQMPKVTTTPSISIIIVATNAEHSLRCLAGLEHHTTEYAFEVIVVDDGTNDETADVLALVQGIRVFRNNKKRGFAASCNLGVSVSQGTFLLFLRDALVLQPECLNELIKTAQIHEHCGKIGMKLVAPNSILWEAGGSLKNNGDISRWGSGDDPMLPSYNYCRVSVVGTSAVFIKKTLFDQIGGFDYQFDTYAEIDMALTLEKFGYMSYYQPLAWAAILPDQPMCDETERILFIRKWNSHLNAQTRCGRMPAQTPNVLFIDTITPTPDQDAGSGETFNHLRIFHALGFHVTFAPAVSLEPTPKYTDDLQRMGIECLYAPYAQSLYAFIEQYGRDYDIVFLVRVNTAAQFIAHVKRYCPQSRVIFNTVDLHYLREMRRAEIVKSDELMKQAQKIRKIEFDVMKMADCTLVVSAHEKELLQATLPGVHIAHLPIFTEINDRQHALFRERQDILFVGGFKHEPNVDAMRYFVKDVWPLIRTRLPGVKFKIVGSHTPQEILDLAAADVVVVGYQEDISEYFNGCRLSVAPIRYGAGLKGKVIRSLGYGLPVVATSIANEGTGLIDQLHIAIADDASSFAEAVVTLYTNETLWKSLSENSVTFFEEHYSFAAGTRNFTKLIADLGIRKNEQTLPLMQIDSLAAYQAHKNAMEAEYNQRLQVEESLVGTKDGFKTRGYCYVCNKSVDFKTNFLYALPDMNGRLQPNWREHLVCPYCGLNNRMRAAIHIFEQECHPQLSDEIYLTEQTTPLFKWFAQNYSHVTGSEYLGSTILYGGSDKKGIRNETLTSLTFAENQFNHILSFDVFEHIPDYEMAFRECLRCLKPGGNLVFTVPFARTSEQHVIRARLLPNGKIEHVLPPEYHGDPLSDKGVLCFYHFGWQLLEQLRSMGFVSVAAQLYWHKEFGYLGQEQMIFIAKKGERDRTLGEFADNIGVTRHFPTVEEIDRNISAEDDMLIGATAEQYLNVGKVALENITKAFDNAYPHGYKIKRILDFPVVATL